MFKEARKRPIEVEAVMVTESNIVELSRLVDGVLLNDWNLGCWAFRFNSCEGRVTAQLGDYIVNSTRGYYLRTSDTFEKHYEFV